jgi:hypothetical protein
MIADAHPVNAVAHVGKMPAVDILDRAPDSRSMVNNNCVCPFPLCKFSVKFKISALYQQIYHPFFYRILAAKPGQGLKAPAPGGI